MSQIIDFNNFQPSSNNQVRTNASLTIQPEIFSAPEYTATEEEINQTRELLLQQFPGLILYSQEEAAKALNVSYQLVNKLCKQGKIKSVRMGRRILINVNEISRIILEGINNGYKKTA